MARIFAPFREPALWAEAPCRAMLGSLALSARELLDYKKGGAEHPSSAHTWRPRLTVRCSDSASRFVTPRLSEQDHQANGNWFDVGFQPGFPAGTVRQIGTGFLRGTLRKL